jgi:uncharacterized protein (TIGR04255 family)
MIFPDSTRVVYAVDVIEEVICQLQFPDILAIGTEPPTQFQEAIREQYPLYERQEGIAAPPEIAEFLSQLQVPAPGGAVRHHFSTADGNRSVTLTAQFLAISERSYSEWKNLRDEIERARKALEEIYQPAFYTRTGLRYRDILDRKVLNIDNEWSELLSPAVAGYLGASQANIDKAVTETTANLMFTDPETEATHVRLQHGIVTREGDPSNQLYSIDADYHTLLRLEGGTVLDVLDGFNHEAGNLFRWSTTPTLRDALGVRDGVEDGS